MAVSDVCRKHGVSATSFYGWRTWYAGMQVSDAKRLRELEDENRGYRAHRPEPEEWRTSTRDWAIASCTGARCAWVSLPASDALGACISGRTARP